MKSSTKVILFCRVADGRKTHLYPVSVHANEATARSFAVMCHMAHGAGNAELLKQLDPNYPFGENNSIHKDSKWSAKPVQYEPTVEADNVLVQDTPAPSTT